MAQVFLCVDSIVFGCDVQAINEAGQFNIPAFGAIRGRRRAFAIQAWFPQTVNPDDPGGPGPQENPNPGLSTIFRSRDAYGDLHDVTAGIWYLFNPGVNRFAFANTWTPATVIPGHDVNPDFPIDLLDIPFIADEQSLLDVTCAIQRYGMNQPFHALDCPLFDDGDEYTNLGISAPIHQGRPVVADLIFEAASLGLSCWGQEASLYDEQQPLWDEMRVTYAETLGVVASSDYETSERLAFRNAALTFLRVNNASMPLDNLGGNQNLDRVDRAGGILNPGIPGPGGVWDDIWSRGWNVGATAVLPDTVDSVFTTGTIRVVGGVTLDEAGNPTSTQCSFPIEWVLIEIEVHVRFNPYRAGTSNAHLIAARSHIYMTTAVRAVGEIPECVHVRYGTGEIVPLTISGPVNPEVTGGPHGVRLEYVASNGVVFDPLFFLQWIGDVGPCTAPEWRLYDGTVYVDDEDTPSQISTFCCAIAFAIRQQGGVLMPRFESRFQERDERDKAILDGADPATIPIPSELYAGSMSLNFNHFDTTAGCIDIGS